MTNVQKVNEAYCLDSGCVRIAINDLSYVHPSLRSKILKVDEYTGDVLETSNSFSTQKINELSLGIKKGRHTGNGANVECLYIACPSKVLHSNYFDGFTLDNIGRVHDILTGSGLVNFSTDALLGASRSTDMDICQSTYANDNFDFAKYTRLLKKDTKASVDLGKGVKTFNNRNTNGIGIQWGTREFASPAYPYLKFYDKCLELSTKSASFAQAHLQGFDYQNLIRKEVTIKNAAHFKRHLSKDFTNSLYNVLSLSQDDLKRYMDAAIKTHLHKITAYQTKEKDNDLKTRDQLLYNYILRDIENLLSYSQIEDFAIMGVKPKERSRAKRHIAFLYERAMDERKEGITGELPF